MQDSTRLCLTHANYKITESDYWDHQQSQQCYHHEKLCGCKCRRAIFHIHETGKQPSSKLHPGAESSERSFLIWFSGSPRGRGGSSCWWRSRCCRCCCCCQTSPSSGWTRHSTVQTQLSGILQTTTETTCLSLNMHWCTHGTSCGSSRNDQDVKIWLLFVLFFHYRYEPANTHNYEYAQFWTGEYTQHGTICHIFCSIMMLTM